MLLVVALLSYRVSKTRGWGEVNYLIQCMFINVIKVYIHKHISQTNMYFNLLFFSFLLFLSQRGGGGVNFSNLHLDQQRYLHERGPLRDNIDRIVTFFL